jgi:hypothetical protein
MEISGNAAFIAFVLGIDRTYYTYLYRELLNEWADVLPLERLSIECAQSLDMSIEANRNRRPRGSARMELN